MRASFALNLSPDGITLLHRAKHGWHRVGDVSLDEDDLPGALAVLRRTAAELSQGGLTSKLIIPDSQILYTDIPDPGPDAGGEEGGADAARAAAVRAALDGATPYALNEIVHDWRVKDGRLHIAAVAKETLEEAEEFAAEHRFNPVSFAAMPDHQGFPGEPFFGPAASGAALLEEGESVEPESEGAAPLPNGKAPVGMVAEDEAEVAAPVEEPEEEAGQEEAEPAEGEASDSAALEEAPAEETPIEDEPAEDEPEEDKPAEPAPAEATIAAAPVEAASETEKPEVEATASEPEADTAEVASEVPEEASGTDAETASEAVAEPEDKLDEAPEPAAARVSDPEPKPFISRRIVPRETDGTARLAALPARFGFGGAPQEAAEPAAPPAPETTHVDITAGTVAGGEAPEDVGEPEEAAPPPPAPKARKPRPPGFLPEPAPVPSPRGGTPIPRIAPLGSPASSPDMPPPIASGRRVNIPAGGTGAGTAPAFTPGASAKAPVPPVTRNRDDRPWLKGAVPAAGLPKAPPPLNGRGPIPPIGGGPEATSAEAPVPPARSSQPRATEAKAESEKLTIFGARNTGTGRGAARGGQRYLGLALTAGLLLVMLVAALLSGYLVQDEARLADPGAAGIAPAEDAQEAIAAAPPVFDPMPDEGADEAPEAVGDEAPLRAAPETAEAPAETLPADLAPGEDLADSLAAAMPAEEGLDSVAGAEAGEEATELADAPEAETAAPETAEAAPETAPEPAPEAAPSPEELAARYAATGIWPVAPEAAPGNDGADRIEDLYIASIDPRITQEDAVALPAAPAAESRDVPPAAPAAPAPAGTTFDIGENGLVRATPEGALTPEGAVVYAGRPPVTTPPRPAAAEAAAEAQAAEDAGASASAALRRLEGFRPALRPADLIESNERSNLGGLTRAELAAIRPQPRPAAITERAAAAAAPAEAPEVAPESEAELAAAAAAAASAASLAATPPEPIRITRALVEARPRPRPADFARTVARAHAAPQRVAAAAAGGGGGAAEEDDGEGEAIAAAPARAPAIPTSASVARQATVKNAINLRNVNLIGVYGTSSQRRALVRLPSGRYDKVKVGDRLDGGRVRAIGSNSLIYNKNGRDYKIEVAG